MGKVVIMIDEKGYFRSENSNVEHANVALFWIQFELKEKNIFTANFNANARNVKISKISSFRSKRSYGRWMSAK